MWTRKGNEALMVASREQVLYARNAPASLTFFGMGEIDVQLLAENCHEPRKRDLSLLHLERPFFHIW